LHVRQCCRSIVDGVASNSPFELRQNAAVTAATATAAVATTAALTADGAGAVACCRRV
jgi:hypothetical protein